MSRPLRLALLIVVALVVVSFFPFFVERTVMRSYTEGGESIRYGWAFGSLYGVWGESGLWRAVNLGLAGAYALLIGAAGLRVWDRVDAR